MNNKIGAIIVWMALFLLGGVGAICANTHYRFIHITTDNGLPHQEVGDMLQDDRGRLWVGTGNGLTLYDGYGFKTYFSSSDSCSINHNFIKAIHQDCKGRIWVATYDGICRYEPATDNFHRYKLERSSLSSIAEMSDGRLVCAGSELYVYDEDADRFCMVKRDDEEFILSLVVSGNRLYAATNRSIFYYEGTFAKRTHLDASYYADFLTGFDGVVPMFEDSDGRVWIGCNGKGVMCVDFASGQKTVYGPAQLANGVVNAIAEDEDKSIWLGTEGGLTVIKSDGRIDILKQNFLDKGLLSDNVVKKVLCDNNGNLWVSTRYGGINVLLNKSVQFGWVEAGTGDNKLKGKVLNSIVQPNDRELWISAESGNGINIYDIVTGKVSVFDRIPGISNRVQSLFYDAEDDDMWIGTFRDGLLCYDMKSGAYRRWGAGDTGLPTDAVFAMAQQRNGRLWVGTTQGLRYFDKGATKFEKINHDLINFDFCFSLCVDRDDNVWVGTRDAGLFCIKSGTGEVVSWENEVHDKFITCIYQDSKGFVWFGSNNSGLQCVDPSTMELVPLEDGFSLSNMSICSIIESPSGELWVSTNNGLYQFGKKRDSLTHYVVEDGLPTNSFNFQSALLASDGLLYVGAVDGLVSFNPKDVRPAFTTLEVYLKNLALGENVMTANDVDSPIDDDIENVERLTLSYDQSRWFSVEYGAVSLDDANAITYQVQLVGVDSEWRNVGADRKFMFHNLSPGDYKLRIRANKLDGDWERQPIKELVITIKPPFYQSTLAYVFYVLVAVLLTFVVYRFFNLRLREKNAARLAGMEVEKLKELNQMKLDFFSMVSHELRTPLSLIMAPLKYIAGQGELSKKSLGKLDVAIGNTNKMIELIDELVTFNKVESGNFQFFVQEDNPMKFISNLASLFVESANYKGISLYVNCEDNGEEVWFSPSYVERIVNNLLSNALKYTNEGGQIFVNAMLVDGEDGYTYLRLKVADTGIGIAKSEQQNIFKEHYQTKSGYNKNHKGWGLGLALVKKLSVTHGGDVAVESEESKGSVFTVNLNVSESVFNAEDKIGGDKLVVSLNHYEYTIPTLVGLNASVPNDTRQVESKLSILIVEDNSELLKFLFDLFAGDYNVYTAVNGKVALDIALNNPIDIVLSDIMMPEMDGNTLCRNIKNDISTSHIPVVLLTAKSDDATMKQGFESGAEAYVQKPFDPEILQLQVKNILNARQLQRDSLRSSQGRDVDATSLSNFDKEFINTINEIVDKHIEDSDFSVTDITQLMGISRTLLHVKMKGLFNLSMGDYIRKKRFAKACELLKKGYKISEAAYMAGFADPNYFSKSFKKEYNMTPTEYLMANYPPR